jgi:hypothetical protein
MIDGLLNRLKKTGERVQRRSEEVAQSARLRLDIFQLGRELDALYARLGRAYHASASVSTLEEVRAEISRVDEEIAAREKLLSELSADLQQDDFQPKGAEAKQTLNLSKSPDLAASNVLQEAHTLKEPEGRTMTDSKDVQAPSGPSNPNEAGEGDKLKPTDNTASMGNEAGRDVLEEGKRATEHPDPLADKD